MRGASRSCCWGEPQTSSNGYHSNEKKLSEFLVKTGEKIARAMGASSLGSYGLGEHFDAGVPYGIIHQVGGAMTGSNPSNSVVNKYLQSWDVSNLFVVGANAVVDLVYAAIDPRVRLG